MPPETVAEGPAWDRVTGNVEALRALRRITVERRPADAGDRAALMLWTSFGGLAWALDEARADLAALHAEMRRLLPGGEYEMMRRNPVRSRPVPAGYAGPMWEALAGLGLQGGRVLDPACGWGAMAGLAPGGMLVTGYETDPASARIAAALNPGAGIRCEAFPAAGVPEGTFDAVVGNLPFPGGPGGGWNDPLAPGAYLTGAVAALRPGGIAVVLAPCQVLDHAVGQDRRAVARMADLAGAIRLPAVPGRPAAAGTGPAADLLVLRRRDPGQPPAPGPPWRRQAPSSVPGGTLLISEIFAVGHAAVLGELRAAPGTGGGAVMRIAEPADPAGELRSALRGTVAAARDSGLAASGPPAAGPHEAGCGFPLAVRPVALPAPMAPPAPGRAARRARPQGQGRQQRRR